MPLMNQLRLALSQFLLGAALRVAPKGMAETRIIAEDVGDILQNLIGRTSDLSAVLRAERLAVAQARYETYAFDLEVEDADGFEFTEPGDEFTRTVYFPGATGAEDTTAGQFTIRFEPNTARVAECHARIDGNPIGFDPASRGSKAAS